MPGDISILKFNNILHWQTHSCLRPTLNRRYFTLLISFSSTAAPHLSWAQLPPSQIKFTSKLAPFIACCHHVTVLVFSMPGLLFSGIKPAQRDVEFGWFSLLCALHTGQCDGDSATLSHPRGVTLQVQHLCPDFLPVDLQRNQEPFWKWMQAKQNFSILELQQLLIN